MSLPSLVGTTLKLWMVQFSVTVWGRGSVHCPSSWPLLALKKNSDLSGGALTLWQRGALPPPGSCPNTSTSPSQEKAPEWPMLTLGTVTVYICSGLGRDPPAGPPMLNTVNPFPPAQMAFMAVPRMTL